MKGSRMVTALALSTFMLSVAALSITPASASHLSGYSAPTGLEAWVDGDDVTLQWDAYSAFPAGCTQAQEIRIFREFNSGGTFDQITSVGPTDTEYIDEDLANGTYVYKIQARCNVGPPPSPPDVNNVSLFSNTAEADVGSAPACAGAPTVEASASPMFLWPPNGKLVPITVMGTVIPQSNCSLPESIVYSIVDEYGELSSSTSVTVALVGATFSFQVSLEASRRGDDLDGRLYTIQLDTADGGMLDIDVTVPHDQRKK